MKNIFRAAALILCVLIAASLFACKNGPQTADTVNDTDPQPTVTSAVTDAVTDTAAESAGTSATEAETAPRPSTR